MAQDLLTPDDPRTRTLVRELRSAGCRLQTAPNPVMDELTQGRSIGPIVGLVRRPPPPDLDRLVLADAGRRSLLLVALDADDPGNVGALVRTGLACGATAFIGVGRSDPYHPKAVRTSMGSLFKLPLLHFDDSAAMFDRLRALDVETIGAVSCGGQDLREAIFDRPRLALILGSEAFGLGADALACLDRTVSIPMAAALDSLSVNAAAAILLYGMRCGRSGGI